MSSASPASTEPPLVHRRGDEDLSRFPNFFLIGPQRTGTTWLHENLECHPNLFLPHEKELYFFSTLGKPDHPKHHSHELSWYLRHFEDRGFRHLRRAIGCRLRQGRPYRPRLRGESTASYATLEPAVIEEVRALNPQLKAIVLIRDPVDRAWSHAKKDLLRDKGRRYAPELDEELMAFCQRGHLRRCARYGEILDHWTEAFGQDQVFIGWFSDIAERPAELLQSVCEFLQVDYQSRFFPGAEAIINPSGALKIPESLKAFLEDLHTPDRQELERRFGRWA